MLVEKRLRTGHRLYFTTPDCSARLQNMTGVGDEDTLTLVKGPLGPLVERKILIQAAKAMNCATVVHLGEFCGVMLDGYRYIIDIPGSWRTCPFEDVQELSSGITQTRQIPSIFFESDDIQSRQ